jgi:supervillin
VEVPSFDDESLLTFFPTNNSSSASHPNSIVVSVDDFDELFINSQDILQTTRRVKPVRRAKAGASRNPLKTMSMLVEVQHEYTDVRTDIAQRELLRIKRQPLVGTPQLAQEALNGLASKENFSVVTLRKADSFHGTGIADRHRPYKDLMLLVVKGRRVCQTRLVEPCVQSVNSGDSHLLITPDAVHVWLGAFSNVIERSKASDLGAQIHQKHDLGVRPTSQLFVIHEEKHALLRSAQRFWTTLGADAACTTAQTPGSSEEDELYESFMNEVNFVYTFDNDALIMSTEHSHKALKHGMLDSKKVYAFDFGSEFYVWTGKHVAFEKRKRAIGLALEVWERGYDYREYNINPLSPLRSEEGGGAPPQAPRRPPWALFGKQSENMETQLFKEKFIDWPDAARVIRVKDGPTANQKVTQP